MIVNANSIRIPLTDGSVHCVITSPPYWGLRSYLAADDPLKALELGAEPLHDCVGWATGAPCGVCYVCHMVSVFREVRRVLRADGVLFLNLGDSYASGAANGGQHDFSSSGLKRDGRSEESRLKTLHRNAKEIGRPQPVVRQNMDGLKPKDLVGIPWRVALALQADGWWLRSDIIWAKPNPMPESVTDRPTKAHEYVFLLSKSPRYFYDAEAVKEGFADERMGNPGKYTPHYQIGSDRNDGNQIGASGQWNADGSKSGRNRRTVWTVATRPFSGAHFATFPPDLVAPMVLAGTSQRGCCAICGAPWERETERESRVPWELRKAAGANSGSLERGYNENHGRGTDHTLGVRVETTGWAPTCTHDAEPVPAIVLDPFAGSGTLGEVCRETGRKFVGLDLNATYLRELALPRAERKQAVSAIEALPLFTMGGDDA